MASRKSEQQRPLIEALRVMGDLCFGKNLHGCPVPELHKLPWWKPGSGERHAPIHCPFLPHLNLWGCQDAQESSLKITELPVPRSDLTGAESREKRVAALGSLQDPVPSPGD